MEFSSDKLIANKIASRFIGPFIVSKKIGSAYTLIIPTSLRLHPTFYVRRPKEHRPAKILQSAQQAEAPIRNADGPLADLGARPTSPLAVFPFACG